MYDLYIRERGKEYVETEHGFAVYHLEGVNLHIDELFILKEHRKNKNGTELVKVLESIAQVNDKKLISCCCDVEPYDSPKKIKEVKTISIKAALAYGFIPHEAHNNRLTLHKEV